MFMRRIQNELDQNGFGKNYIPALQITYPSHDIGNTHLIHAYTLILPYYYLLSRYRSKTLPITHRPNWNDVRIIRAILSLIEAALRDGRATHLLLCTESCIPVATLKEVARSVLLDEVCLWEEETTDGHSGESQKQRNSNRSKRRELNWDRSYVDCYDRKSRRCTRFDEREL